MQQVQVRHIGKKFQGNQEWVLRDVSFDWHAGQLLCLRGRSGCGKSTLARILSRLEKADNGTIAFHGAEAPFPYWRPLQLITQDAFNAWPPFLTIGEAFLEINRFYRREMIRPEVMRPWLQLLQLPADVLERRPTAVSGGQKQRLAIMRALLAQPRFVVADEVTSSLDDDNVAVVAKVWAELRRREIGVLLISHDPLPHEVVVDRVLTLHQGCLTVKETSV